MPPYTIILTDFGESDWDIELQVLYESGLDINLVRLETRVPEQLIPRVATADALIVQWASINRQVIDALQRCKVISRYGIGVDMIDLEAASERGIIVANVHDYCIEEVSTQTIGFVLDQPVISSALVDNLNASIHLRALLTDLFLIDQALKGKAKAASPSR